MMSQSLFSTVIYSAGYSLRHEVQLGAQQTREHMVACPETSRTVFIGTLFPSSNLFSISRYYRVHCYLCKSKQCSFKFHSIQLSESIKRRRIQIDFKELEYEIKHRYQYCCGYSKLPAIVNTNGILAGFTESAGQFSQLEHKKARN